MRISDWSSDVCSSDLPVNRRVLRSAANTGRKPAKAKESFSTPKPKQLSKTTGSANRQSRSFFVSDTSIKGQIHGLPDRRRGCDGQCRTRSPRHPRRARIPIAELAAVASSRSQGEEIEKIGSAHV